MKQSSSIIIGKYCLEPLLRIRQDDISSMLGSKPGVYICENPSLGWYNHFGFKQINGIGHVGKKCRVFSQMAKGSKWISPTSDVPKGKHTQLWKNGDILHLGHKSFPWRCDQILQTFFLFCWLLRHRKEYDYCLVYNFYLPIYLAPLCIKFLLGKRLYADYEDDYTKQRKNIFKNFLERLLRHTVTGVICINEYMTGHFTKKQVRVLNAFADLKYTDSIDFNLRDGTTFLFSGTFDKIRGIELIPDLLNALRQHIKNFKILITGNGPLKPLVQSWNYPEVKYLGLLNNTDFICVIKQADAYLVLQKPDHPFSLGSFPSKVETYARYKKPIYRVSVRDFEYEVE